MLNLKLKRLADKIEDKDLNDKVEDFLENPTFELNGKMFSGPSFEISPGGLAHHHRYEGGYIEHVIATAELALALCDVVEKVYFGRVNRDLVIAGVLLHDIFKPLTYALNENGAFTSSEIGEYIDHVSLVTSELVRRDFPLELVHIVASHYGSYGPIEPRTIEALVVHLADNTDSQLNGRVLNAAGWLTRRATGEYLESINSKEAFEIIAMKATEGWKGVQKMAERIRQQQEASKTLKDLSPEEKQGKVEK